MAILRYVETEAPVTFAFHPPPPFPFDWIAGQLRLELPWVSVSRECGTPREPIPVSRE